MSHIEKTCPVTDFYKAFQQKSERLIRFLKKQFISTNSYEYIVDITCIEEMIAD